jgi:predicted enzyme related to lactoylglutathione lyase/uncharacterized glyoxalase superfamily protein PhnB
MIENRSVPPDTILPHVSYRDLEGAIAWLTRTFGFREHYRYGNPVSGSQVHLDNAWIMLNRIDEGGATPAELGYGTQSLTVFVEDVDAHFARTWFSGARILEDLHETVYGERQYGVEDLEGHHWLFSKHATDRGPEEWGAEVVESSNWIANLPHPRFCYLQVPALDVHESARFYEAVFGWNIRGRDTTNPRFDTPPGNISGAWVTGRPPAREPGLLPYIWVDSIEETLARVVSNGGAVVDASHPDNPGSTSRIATFYDPAGNLIGLYTEA